MNASMHPDHEMITLCGRLVELASEERHAYDTIDDDEREAALEPLDAEGFDIEARLRELAPPVSREGAAAMALAALAEVAAPRHRNDLTTFGEWMDLTARTFLGGPAAAASHFDPIPIPRGAVKVGEIIAFVDGVVAGIVSMAGHMGGTQGEALKTLLYGLTLGVENAHPGAAWTMETARMLVRSVESQKSVAEYIPVMMARASAAPAQAQSIDAFETGTGFGAVS